MTLDEINSIKQDIESLKESRNRARMRIDSLENWAIEIGNPDIFKKIADLEKDVKLANRLADEILTLKEKLLALEKLAKDSEIRIDVLECGGKPFQCPDKAGDNVTLEDMKGNNI